AAETELRSTEFLRPSQIRSILVGPDEARVDEVVRALEKVRARAVSLMDREYPAALRAIDAPPAVLYVRGSLEDIEPAVAVVGTRSPSVYGKRTAFFLARDLSLSGVSVVSGLARGIDREAHLGALEGIAKTVAVLGSGIDTVYPKEHEDLASRIERAGAVVSELPPGTKPEAGNFPRRNRIISALAQAVVVVEATTRSGAMITARLGLEQGKVVMAVPGNVTNLRSQGPHHLIRQGAVLVERAADVIAEIAPSIASTLSRQPLKQPGSRTDEILNMASSSPVTIEEIAQHLGIDVSEATRRVSTLEIEGSLERVTPNRFIARDVHG
ncbi:MAG TPA: DNA-processing protein DprA, partial [Deltaproteobacteria bacterium]|nr:DNA-processing protein DprA [Deltaproteobacteria bacterium]